MRFELPLIAPIPVGHAVTIYKIEERSEKRRGEAVWTESDLALVTDDDTRIVYAARFLPARSLKYGAIELAGDNHRIASRVRGRVTECAVITDRGEPIAMTTQLEIEVERAGYR